MTDRAERRRLLRAGQKVKPSIRKKWLGWLVLAMVIAVTATVLLNRRSSLPEHAVLSGRPPTIEERSEFDQYAAIVKELVQSHPSPQIADTLNQLVERGVIFLSYSAEMHYLGGAAACAALQLINIDGAGVRPVMEFSIPALVSRSDSKESKQLVIFHEFQHYRQLAEKRYPPESFYGHREDAPVSEATVALIYRSECEAYLAEAQFAQSVGWSSHNDFCQVYAAGGEQVLRLHIAQRLGNAPALAKHREYLLTLAHQSTAERQ